MPRRDLTFRIFVSSTFSDFIRERNALQRVVFPRLREYCRGQGARFPGIEPRFQAIDLRWGVAREAALDQQTMSICVAELHRCQRLSPKPNFIVLVGDRYGWIPLPERVPAGEFEELMEHFTEEQRRLIIGTAPVPPWRDGRRNPRRGWYRLDRNARPSAEPPGEYVLQPRTIDVPADCDTETRRRIQAEESDDWSDIEREIRLALAAAIERAGWPPDDPRREKYERSATHQEIRHGALSVENADDHVYCYFRTIGGLPGDPSARGFVDLDERGQPDPVAAERLRRLRQQLEGTEQSAGAIPQEHCHRYTVAWEALRGSSDNPMSGVIDGADGPEPAPDLRPFCQWVESDLKAIIDRELEAFEGETGPAREERLHAEFTQPLTEHFVGRERLLQEIEDWCTGSSTTPLVVSGVSGSGKTALTAMVQQRLAARRPEAVVLARFIGATPGSTELRTLLIDLCRQLGAALGIEGSLPAEASVSELRRELETRLASATAERPVFLLIDALDQLAPTDSAHMLWWLPRNLPEHARLVVTVLEREDESGEADRVARRMFPDSLVSLAGLDREEADRLLDLWLADADRTLQPHQRQIVLDGFEHSPWPLYLRTAFDEARRWKSWDEPPPLGRDVPELLASLFERLSQPQNHGDLMVRRSLGYLGAARRGLTEDELLDVLSREKKVDPDQPSVLDEFQARSPDSPHTDRLPIVAWSRLYAELESNVTERQAYGAAVLSFYHRQVQEAVERQFLNEAERPRAHRHLADYFRSQDYFRESLEEQRARARRLPPTPRPANIRKVDELPYHVLEIAKLLGDNDPTSPHWDAVADLMTDWQFLEAKAEAQPEGEA